MAANYDLEGALRILEDDGIVLLPTDTLWSIGCNATNIVAVKRLTRLLVGPDAPAPEILVHSIAMLKNYVQQLHPRLETLLFYHVRPLTILLENPGNFPEELEITTGKIAFRVAQDDYCRQLIRRLGHPLATAYAGANGQDLPVTFGMVSSAVIEGVDYVARHRQSDRSPGEPSVMVCLSDKSELVFLRE